MRRLSLYLFALIGACLIGNAQAGITIVGEYACAVHEKAGIASIHLEDSGPPAAYLEHEIQSTFGMKIEATLDERLPYKATETTDRGNNPDGMEYHTQFSVLHSAYLGNGSNFGAAEDQAFLRIYNRKDGGLYFYHAGFEYPGGEDVRLSVRYGECSPKR